jgi:choline dehydrogenase
MDAYRGPEIQPGEAVQSDEEIDAFVRSAVESAYHPSCACRMGEDEGAVVDSETRVHGIEALRLVDSSIFPTIPNGNLNSPTIMLAERAADIIKGKGMLEPSDAAVGLGRDWETLQRSITT